MRLHRENPNGITTFNTRSFHVSSKTLPRPPLSSDGVEDDLSALNAAATKAYFAGQDYILSNLPPILVVDPEKMTFYPAKDSNGEIRNYTPQLYTILKSISHIVLGTVGVLRPMQDDPQGNSGKWVPLLEQLLEKGQTVLTEMGDTGLEEPALSRNIDVLSRMLVFIRNSVGFQDFQSSTLETLAREMGPFMLANSNDAAIAQIDELDKQTHEFEKSYGSAFADESMVLIEVGHQPRVGYVQGQYFSYYLGETDQTRLIYGENISDDATAKSLVATVLHDRMLASDIFDNPFRMERDLLGDAADAYLLRKFGRLGNPIAPK